MVRYNARKISKEYRYLNNLSEVLAQSLVHKVHNNTVTAIVIGNRPT
jgi:hypothetical protein